MDQPLAIHQPMHRMRLTNRANVQLNRSRDIDQPLAIHHPMDRDPSGTK
jgi:hypothetical protein